MLGRCRGDRHRPPRGPRRRAGRPRAPRRCRRADADRGLARPHRAVRRPGVAEVREPAAHGLVQDPRRVHPDRPARRRRSARGGWSRRARATTRRASRSPPRCSGITATVFMPDRRGAAEGRRDPGLRRRGAPRRPHRRREPRRGAPVREPRPAPCWCTPSTTSTSSPGRAPSGWRSSSRCPTCARCWSCTGGGGLLGGVAAAVKGLRPDVAVVGVQARGRRGLAGVARRGRAGDAAVDAHDRRRHRGRPPGRRHVRPGRRAGRRHRHGRRGRAVAGAAALPGAREAASSSRPARRRWRR